MRAGIGDIVRGLSYLFALEARGIRGGSLPRSRPFCYPHFVRSGWWYTVRNRIRAGGTRAARTQGAAGKIAEGESTLTAIGLARIALDVSDIPRSRDWYKTHLGLTPMSESERSCFLRCGPDFLAMFKADKPGLNHYCNAINNYDPAKALETLKVAGLNPRREENRVYFLGPDGIAVQIHSPNR